jgi:DNA-binding Lrp family transcriptional regulator
MKNSRKSDRELARILGVSQPTVSRKRVSLEKEIIENYTIIPTWHKLGYDLFAITLVKVRVVSAIETRYNEVRKRGAEWLVNQPNVLMAGGCRGMGVESFMISIHKTYADFDKFMNDCRFKLGDLFEITQSIIVNLAGDEVLKPFNPAYLAQAEARALG